MELAENTNDFLLGLDEHLVYPFEMDNQNDVEETTQKMISFWYERWMKKRLQTIDIVSRLQSFDKDMVLLSRTR